MNADVVIKGGTLVTGEGLRRAAIAVKDGKIAAVDRDDAMPEAREVIDATGKHLIPGFLDSHCHLRDPGKVEREDWSTGTQAAAAGGVTTILEMPIAMPSVHSAETLRNRVAHCKPMSYVDFAFYGAANGDILDNIEAMAAAGAVGFKTFRTDPVPGRENEFIGICCPDAGQMVLTMEKTAKTGLLHVVHCEDQQILNVTMARAKAIPVQDGRAHAASRPEVSESPSVAQCIAIAQATGARFQVAHMSSRNAIDLVRRAKENGLAVTAETCPAYLMFAEEDLFKFGPYAKCNPPLRPQETQDALWEAVREGVIEVIGTDHSPFLVSEKEPFKNDISRAAPGFPGLEQFLPSMLTAVNQGRITLPQMVKVVCENTARLFGLAPRKGHLAVGADADVVLVDMNAKWVHDHTKLYTKARDTALVYDGRTFHGMPTLTMIRGKVVARDSKVVGAAGWGEWIRPQ